MMAAGLIDTRRMITAYYVLEDAVDAIAQSTARADGKIIVRV
jgi:Flp pilus assembly protein TadG